MPKGKKQEYVHDTIFEDFADIPILVNDRTCATIHAQIRADCRRKGKPLAFADSQIASIAMANNAVLVTRNVKDFADIEGLQLVNWFE